MKIQKKPSTAEQFAKDKISIIILHIVYKMHIVPNVCYQMCNMSMCAIRYISLYLHMMNSKNLTNIAWLYTVI